MFSNAKSVEINGKEVKSIIFENRAVLYEKNHDMDKFNPYLILGFTGSQFSVPSRSLGLTGNNIVINWGDGTTTNYSSASDLNHTYNVSGDYTIVITGVTGLGNSCFYNCSGLTSITIPDSVTSLEPYCFYNCSGLTSVTIPDNVTILGQSCFCNCSGLTSITLPDNLTTIGIDCFLQCTGLTSITIPDSVTSLRPSIFYGCVNLESIILNWNNNNDILTYDSSWISNANSSLKFIIPDGTTALYVAKNYPSNLLIEHSIYESHLTLTSDKDILSYYDNDVATLTATLSKNNSALSNEQVLFYDSDRVSLATYYDWLDVFLFTVTSENKGEIIFDTTNAEHNNFYVEDTASGGGYSNGGRVKFVITDTQVETWRYNSSTDTWTKSMMLYNLPVKIGFSYGTEIISNTAKIPFFASATTDNNGEATATYNSIGIGDVTITAECMNLQETYEVHDYYAYRETGSQIFTSSSWSSETLYDLEDIGDCEVTYEISATGNKGFAIAFSSNELNNLENAVRGQVDSAGYYGTYTSINNSQTYTLYNNQYSANNYFAVTIRYVNGNVTVIHNGKTHTDNRTFNLRYLRIYNWNSAKTINYKNLIVKPL